jgi:transcription antitermination factor NusG
MENTRKWYAIAAKPRAELMVELGLEQRGFEVVRPTYWEKRRWSDRMKWIELPLFPGYVFCRMSLDQRMVALSAPGVRLIVGFGGVAVPVPDAVMDSLRCALGSGRRVTPWDEWAPGDEVEVGAGPLLGLRGALVEVRSSSRIVVQVELLRRAVAVELDPADVIRTAESAAVHQAAMKKAVMGMGGVQ